MQAFSLDGQLCEEKDATISVMDHGLLYGDGVFEGLRFYAGKIFKLDAHLRRLEDSARAIDLALPMPRSEVEQALYRTVQASKLSNGYIRLIVTRGVGNLGLNPANCHSPRTIIIVAELSMIPDHIRDAGARVIIVSTRRMSSDELDPRIKSLNYLTQILARQEANVAGADEAILLNRLGRVAEGTADNVFIVKNGQLQTPPTSEGALDGITRNAIIELATRHGIPVSESLLAPYDLYTADECFLTGTGAELIPVAMIDGRELGDKRPVYETLSAAFSRFVQPGQDSANFPADQGSQ